MKSRIRWRVSWFHVVVQVKIVRICFKLDFLFSIRDLSFGIILQTLCNHRWKEMMAVVLLY